MPSADQPTSSIPAAELVTLTWMRIGATVWVV
jgi:hypothetical protein